MDCMTSPARVRRVKRNRGQKTCPGGAACGGSGDLVAGSQWLMFTVSVPSSSCAKLKGKGEPG